MYRFPCLLQTMGRGGKQGNLIDTLEQTDISRLIATGWTAPNPVTVKSADGKYDFYGLVFTPSNLDPKKKYPVINYIYPGPQGGSVRSWSFSPERRDHQALAELGFVVVVIEGSCNPGRSKAFHDECYGEMTLSSFRANTSWQNEKKKRKCNALKSKLPMQPSPM